MEHGEKNRLVKPPGIKLFFQAKAIIVPIAFKIEGDPSTSMAEANFPSHGSNLGSPVIQISAPPTRLPDTMQGILAFCV